MQRILIIVIVCCAFVLKAQPPTAFYTKFGGPGVDIGYGVKQTLDRQYIIAGSTTSDGAGNSDVSLTLIDSMGNVKWSKVFGGALSDVAKCVVVNPIDSGFVLAGYTASFGNGGYDFYVIRTDKNGTMKWQSAIGGTDWDFANDLAIGSDGKIVVCGNTYSYGYGGNDGFIIKLNDVNGSLVWQKFYGGMADDDFRSLQFTSDNLISIAGNTKSYGDINNDFWLFKIDNSGDSIMSKVFGNANKAEICYDFMEDNLGKLVFCGSYDTSFYNLGKNEGYLIKTDISGNFITEAKYNGAGSNDKFLSVCKAIGNNNYFFSRSVFKPGFEMEIQPFYTDISFIFINSNTYIGNKDEEAYDVIPTPDGGFAMVGYTKSFGLSCEDVFFLKVDNSLMNSTSIVTIKEEQTSQHHSWYYDNILYFENQQSNDIPYKIISSQGKIVSEGITHEAKIDLPSFLCPGIYVATIGTVTFKFLKTGN
jgi:hypothetical protein